MTTSADAVVIGGGPAGSCAARALASCGHRVLVLDRHTFPREKVCGDALIPDALRALARAGLEQGVRSLGREVRTLRASSPSRIEVDFPCDAVTVPRRQLDAWLLDRAREAGAAVGQADVVAVEEREDGTVHCRSRSGAVVASAHVVLLATGASDGIARRLGLVGKPARAVAIRAYVRSSVELSALLISYDRTIRPGYGWIFPLRDGTYNVGVGIFGRAAENPRRMLQRFLETFPAAREIVAASGSSAGEIAAGARGAPLHCGLAGMGDGARQRVLAVGETIGATFPLTGEGIGKALETAEIAAELAHELLRSGEPAVVGGYRDLIDRRLRPRYRGYELGQRWLGRPWFVDLVARRARANPRINAALAGILDESVDPRAALSLRGFRRLVFG